VRIDRTDSVHLGQDLPRPVDDQAELGAQRACYDQFHIGGAAIEAEIPDQAHVGQVAPDAGTDDLTTAQAARVEKYST